MYFQCNFSRNFVSSNVKVLPSSTFPPSDFIFLKAQRSAFGASLFPCISVRLTNHGVHLLPRIFALDDDTRLDKRTAIIRGGPAKCSTDRRSLHVSPWAFAAGEVPKITPSSLAFSRYFSLPSSFVSSFSAVM